MILNNSFADYLVIVQIHGLWALFTLAVYCNQPLITQYFYPLFRLMIFLVIIGSIYFILLDELIMGCAQRRIGPLNLGWYGFLSSLINGCNLIISCSNFLPFLYLNIIRIGLLIDFGWLIVRYWSFSTCCCIILHCC